MAKKRLTVQLTFSMLLIAIVLLVLAMGNWEAEGKTITVDDGGGADYTKIQDAIDNATAGDEIRVYEGTYYENVVVDKSLDLVGNHSENTTIDAEGNGIVVRITRDWVNFTEFSVKGSGDWDVGLKVEASNTWVFENNVSTNAQGISVEDSGHNLIENNNIRDNGGSSLTLTRADNNIIEGNFITGEFSTGIFLLNASNNQITGNSISRNYDGIVAQTFGGYSLGNEAHHNGISGNARYGMDFSDNGGFSINATNNWWGDVSGPYHASKNSGGEGDEVTDDVDFEPWYTGPGAGIEEITPNPAAKGELVSFTGESESWAEIALYVWTSDIDGELYSGTENRFSSDSLSAGEHIISFKLQDEFGVWSEEAEELVEVEDVATYLEGYVKDDDSGEPVEGAEVKLEGTGYQTTTNETGYYYLKCEEGMLNVMVTHADYQEFSEEVGIEKGENEFEVELMPIQTHLKGYVTDEDSGEPVEGAELKLLSYETTTNDTGYYYLECEEGMFKLFVTHDDYKEFSQDLILEKGKNEYSFGLTIVTYVAGHLKDAETEEPVGGAVVKLTGTGYETTTNESGYYYLMCESGSFTLVFEHASYDDKIHPLTIEKGGNLMNAFFSPTPPAPLTLWGFVKDENSGEPLGGAEVRLDGTADDTATDETGYYVLPCEKGDFTLIIYLDHVNTFSEEISIERNDQQHDVTFPIVTYLEGYITKWDTGEPLDATIYLGPKEMHNRDEAKTNATGYYYLEYEVGSHFLAAGGGDYRSDRGNNVEIVLSLGRNEYNDNTLYYYGDENPSFELIPMLAVVGAVLVLHRRRKDG